VSVAVRDALGTGAAVTKAMKTTTANAGFMVAMEAVTTDRTAVVFIKAL